MSRSLCLLISAFATGAASAQSYAVTFPQPVTLTATALNTTTRTLTAPGGESAAAQSLSSFASAQGSVTLPGDGVQVSTQLTCGTGLVGPQCAASVRAADLRLHITGAGPGALVVTSTSAGSGGDFSVDVGNDGQWEIRGAGSGSGARELLVCPSGPIDVRLEFGSSLTLHSGAQTQLNSAMSLRIAFVARPPAASFEPYGSACGIGIAGTGQVVGPLHQLALSIVAGEPTSPAAFVLGLQRSNVPIAGTPCLLQVVPLVTVPMATDARGEATFGFTIPLLTLRDLVGQAAVLGPSGLRASPGLAVRMQRC